MDRILFTSKVPEESFNKSFRKAYILATLAIFCVLIPWFFHLTIWQSYPFFLIFLGLLIFGFRPYKKLEKIKNKPIHLYVSMQGMEWGTKQVPFHTIQKIEYIDQGIAITCNSKKLFLPFFSRQDFDHLIEISQDLLSQDREDEQGQ